MLDLWLDDDGKQRLRRVVDDLCVEIHFGSDLEKRSDGGAYQMKYV